MWRWLRKDSDKYNFKESHCGQFEVTVPVFAGDTEDNHVKPLCVRYQAEILIRKHQSTKYFIVISGGSFHWWRWNGAYEIRCRISGDVENSEGQFGFCPLISILLGRRYRACLCLYASSETSIAVGWWITCGQLIWPRLVNYCGISLDAEALWFNNSAQGKVTGSL